MNLSEISTSDSTNFNEKLNRTQRLIFFLLWPGANFILVLLALLTLKSFSLSLLGIAALKIWTAFALAFLILNALRRKTSILEESKGFATLWGIHVFVILGCFAPLTPIVDSPAPDEANRVLVIPLALMLLQITFYLVIMRLFHQQAQHFRMQILLRDSELSALRAQSNPHFLFNSLNLIASEIPDDPAKAQNLVYDLADLLRANIALGKKKLARVDEEIQLVELYLQLQQSRFSDRLSFDIDVEEQVKKVLIPALLLQPVIENTVKHAVAPYAKPAHISVSIRMVNQALEIKIKDSGPPFDENQLGAGEGNRILRKTLDLHYGKRYKINLKSTENGGEFCLTLPQ